MDRRQRILNALEDSNDSPVSTPPESPVQIPSGSSSIAHAVGSHVAESSDNRATRRRVEWRTPLEQVRLFSWQEPPAAVSADHALPASPIRSPVVSPVPTPSPSPEAPLRPAQQRFTFAPPRVVPALRFVSNAFDRIAESPELSLIEEAMEVDDEVVDEGRAESEDDQEEAPQRNTRKRRQVPEDAQPTGRVIARARRSRPQTGDNQPRYCPTCQRNCPCPRVREDIVPIVEAPVPQPRQKRQRPEIVDDAWRELQQIDALSNADLPPPREVVVRDSFVQTFAPLTTDRLLEHTEGDSFIAGRYVGGTVVVQGTFTGVPLVARTLVNAAGRAEVLYNDPADPITQIAAGSNHLAMVSERGNLYLIGRPDEGQLGRDPSRYRHLTPSPLNMRRRVVPEREPGHRGRVRELKFSQVEAISNLTTAWTVDGAAYRCGTNEEADWTSNKFVRFVEADRQ